LRSPISVLPTIAFGFAAVALVMTPVFVVKRLEAWLSALSPADFRELEVLRTARIGLSDNPTETQERITLDILDRSTTVAPEWAAARDVLKEQIRESLAKRERDEGWQPEEITDFRDRFSRAWRSAIEGGGSLLPIRRNSRALREMNEPSTGWRYA